MAKKEKRLILSKGSSKILYSLPQDDILLAEFRPELGIDGNKVFRIKDRPRIAPELQAFIFAYLETYQIPTHFFSQSGTELLITVDCGIGSVEEVALARTLGMEVVITPPRRIPRIAPRFQPTTMSP